MRIVITGSTGNIGSKLVPHLIDREDIDLVLVTRNADNVAGWTAKGAEAAVGSLEDPAFVSETLRGADALFFLIPPSYGSDDVRGYYGRLSRIAADAARENGIGHVVTLSSIGAQHADGTGPVTGLHDMETIFNETAENLVHLRPAFFMENFFMDIPAIQASGSLYAPTSGNQPVPMIATQDIAAAAARWLGDLSWSGHQIAELLGPEDVTHRAAAEVISRGTGREISFVQVPPEAAKASMLEMGMSDNMASSLIELYAGIDSGHVTNEFDRTPEATTETSLETFSSEVLKPALEG